MQTGIDFFLAQSENGSIGVDVFPSAHIRMKTGTQFDQAGHPTFDGDGAAVGIEDPCQQLQRGALAAAVVSDQTHGFSTLYRERNVPQHLTVLIPPAVPEQEPFLKALSLVQKHLEVLLDMVHNNCIFLFALCRHYNSSAKPFFNFPNASIPSTRNRAPSTTASSRLVRSGT